MGDLVASLMSDPYFYFAGAMSIAGAIAFIIFLWGVMDYVYSHGNEEEKEHGRTNMLWGTVWLVLIFVMWEFVRFVAGVFN
jgi:cbb3-type cytochrome oxidase subunit 3